MVLSKKLFVSSKTLRTAVFKSESKIENVLLFQITWIK